MYHERGYPDLCGGEEVVADMIEVFNKDHKAVRVILVNQWDWNRQVCGDRMSEEMSFADIRRGTDVEFGLSVYEPFGISQFEPLCFGALCVVSNICGCMGFARQAGGNGGFEGNIIQADYIEPAAGLSIEELMDMSISERDRIESTESRRLAALIDAQLARDDQAIGGRIETGYQLAKKMRWEHVVGEYFLPGLTRAALKC